jgi:hypothetical protein
LIGVGDALQTGSELRSFPHDDLLFRRVFADGFPHDHQYLRDADARPSIPPVPLLA